MATDGPTKFPKLLGDAPKRTIEQDEFGLGKIVDALSQTLIERVGTDGYVLGVQGRWGSGKSTFVAFVAGEIRKRVSSHQIIHFDPWLVGQKAALLSFLLGQLASKIDEAEWVSLPWWRRFDHWLFKRLGRRVANKLRKYGEYSATLATPVGSLATTDPTGTTALAALGLKGVGLLGKILGINPKSLEQLKDEISKDLRKLKNKHPTLRFTVFIDDTDRLEPAEAVEVLRLIRRAADFPLITFVVCFDDEILARQVETALQVDDGHAYIEKIFETVITIPLDRHRLAEAVTAVVDRVKGAGAPSMFAMPQPLAILFCWYQLGDKEDLRGFIATAIEEDDQFLNALHAMSGWSASNEGIRHPIRSRYVELFMDAGSAKARLETLARGDGVAEQVQARAASILRDWSDGSY